MNPFWGNLYDRYKDRRYAILFIATLFVFFGLVVPGTLLLMNLRLADLLPGLSCLMIAITASIWRAVYRTRRQQKPSTLLPLSRDEVRKARSKLMKEQQRHERSLHFGPGGDCGVAGLQRGGGGGRDLARLPGSPRGRQ